MRKLMLAIGCMVGLGTLGSAGLAVAADQALPAGEVADVPVYPYDFPDRPYEVLGEVRASVRKATIFSKAPSQEKIYRELWERGQKMGADAVIKAQYGDAHVTALSWGASAATGIAIKFKPVPAAEGASTASN